MEENINYKVKDCHIHLGISGPWIPGFDPSVTIEQLIQLMDENNIEKAVVFPNPLPGSKYPEANDYIISCIQKYPKRLIGFGRIDPRYGSEIFPEIKKLSNNGIIGVKLHPVVESFYPDHPFFLSVYEALLNYGIKVILAHSSEQGFAEATRWAKVAQTFPQLTIILAHLNKACLPLLKQFNNIYVDTSTSPSYLIEKACNIDSSKILFGSDYPYRNWKEEFEKIIHLSCSREIKEKILYKNFLFLEGICG